MPDTDEHCAVFPRKMNFSEKPITLRAIMVNH
jgi:hypothetical protein